MDFGRERLGPRTVLIGIQARTNSSRLPRKVHLPIEGRTLLERVTDACSKSAEFFNKNFNKFHCTVRVVILCPEYDEIIERYSRRYVVMPALGTPENDVLTRYCEAAAKTGADYVVRITADCVFTDPMLISRFIKSHVYGGYDYSTNVMVRTFREGQDVESMSIRALQWLNMTAKGEDREHVTAMLRDRKDVPPYFRYCHILNSVDDSEKKTSVDTMEDFERAAAEIVGLNAKRQQATDWGDVVA